VASIAVPAVIADRNMMDEQLSGIKKSVRCGKYNHKLASVMEFMACHDIYTMQFTPDRPILLHYCLIGT
jgi:hypothetical protein